MPEETYTKYPPEKAPVIKNGGNTEIQCAKESEQSVKDFYGKGKKTE